jgi:predicted nucleotidyltransferase
VIKTQSVRLRKEEIEIIKKTARKYFGQEAKVVLFGSRTDTGKRGGDIDLLIETSLQVGLKMKIRFLTDLKERLGEQKIDLVLRTPDTPYKKLFEIVEKEGVEL